MRSLRKTLLLAVLASVLLVLAILHSWPTRVYTTVDVWQRQGPEAEKHLLGRLPDADPLLSNISFHVRDHVARYGRWGPGTATPALTSSRPPLRSLLARNGCVCEGESGGVNLPFAQLLFPRVSAQLLHTAFNASQLEEVKQRRAKEFQSFQKRSQTSADVLILAQANSPLQYPTQGVEVRPLKTILVPGLALHHSHRRALLPDLAATLGTLNVAADVDDVTVRGDGEMRMSLSSARLPSLNRQLQFVTYTNTLFHPSTADTGERAGARAPDRPRPRGSVEPLPVPPFSAAPVRGPPRRLQHQDPSRCDSQAVRLWTQRRVQHQRPGYRGYKDVPAVRQAPGSDQQHQAVLSHCHHRHRRRQREPQIHLGAQHRTLHHALREGLVCRAKPGRLPGDHQVFAVGGRRLHLHGRHQAGEAGGGPGEDHPGPGEPQPRRASVRTLVGGAVREVTGYTSTYRQTISIEPGEDDGDCLHMRRGFHHVIQGFPNCVVTDGVINFFLARTDKVQQVGFDPRLARVAHLGEWAQRGSRSAGGATSKVQTAVSSPSVRLTCVSDRVLHRRPGRAARGVLRRRHGQPLHQAQAPLGQPVGERQNLRQVPLPAGLLRCRAHQKRPPVLQEPFPVFDS
ncbi:unnamed protein product [Tetraodon nigroviridis]|uniref:Beta-1,4-N-acetyl-galactosaminyl transferase 1b n=1 Tax=Tetraodon nigroviridis TaxID=99883 RepID=Q4RXW8_TETNG|nr:unnamed protein product [Tetraodon nigroviridis]